MDNRCQNSPNPEKEKILILIPAYNEEERLSEVIIQVRKEMPRSCILVINDGSSDRTEQVALNSGASVLSHPVNLGYGVTLQTGYKYALIYGFDYILQMDADGQHDPKYLPVLHETIRSKAVDVVIGSRFLGKDKYPVGLVRKMGMRFFGFITTMISDQRITDSTSGFRALNRRALEFCAQDSFPGDYPDADLLIVYHKKGIRIQEIPVAMYPNLKKRSMHSGLKPLYYVYKMLLSVGMNMIRKNKY